MNIQEYGWNTYTSHLPTALEDHVGTEALIPARIVSDSTRLYRVVSEAGERLSELTGTLLNSLTEKHQFPTVGDWVAVDPRTDHDRWIIRHILPRYSTFARKVAGKTTEEQVIAANIDFVFVVAGLDGGRNFNLRGLERYIIAVWESGAQPVVVLNKSDLCDDVEGALLSAESVCAGAEVYAVSARTGEGMDKILAIATPQSTVVLTGKSGVGKSSIINQLAGENRLDTGKQREQDLRGRHTTTRRELVRLDSGALLIDTPGLRELQLWGEEESLHSAFPEILEYAAECRFSDCSHSSEPGCAVQGAVASGEIEQARFESYLDMQRELRYLKTKQEAKSRKQKEARGKAIAKFGKELKKGGKRAYNR